MMKREVEPSQQTIDKMVTELREWVIAENISNARTDDHALIQFLYGCKFRLERVRFKLRSYLEMRRTSPEWFAERDPSLPKMAELLDMGVFLPLLQRDDEERYVVLVRATINDPRKIPMVDVFKLGMMVVDLAMEEDVNIAKKGVVVLVDLAGVSVAHSVQMTPNLIRKAVHSWQDCYPVRIKNIIFINCPIYVNVILNIFRKFMRDKLRKRIKVYGTNLTNLKQEVELRVLPEEYGGEGGPLQPVAKHWADKIRQNTSFFLEDVTTKT